MTLWLKARHVPHLVATLLAVGLLQTLLTGRTIILPVLIGHVGVAMWSMFLPVIVGVAVADSMASKTQAVEARVTSRVVLLDVVLLAGIAVGATTTLAALGGTHPQLVGTAGQVLITVGLAASATLWWGLGPGVLAPLALAVTCVAYGSDAPGGQYLRLLAPDSSAWWDLLIGSAVFGLAVGLISTRTVRIGFRFADRLAE